MLKSVSCKSHTKRGLCVSLATLFSVASKQTEVGYLHSFLCSNNRCSGHCSASVRTVSDVHYSTRCSAPSVISGVRHFLPVLVFHTFRTVVRRGSQDIGGTRLRSGRPKKRVEFPTGAKTSSLKHLAPPDFYSVRTVCCTSRCKAVRTLS
jgi:hypothetical protein